MGLGQSERKNGQDGGYMGTFPGGPVVKVPRSQWREHKFNPCLGN